MKLNLLFLTLLLTSLSTDLWSAQKSRASNDEQEEANPKRMKKASCYICLETEEEENGPFITPEAFNGLLTCIHRQVHATCLTAALAENNRCPICRSAGIRQVQAQVVAQAPTNLHIAAEQGNLAEVNQLIAGGANINATDAEGRTPLQRAAYQGNLPVAQALIDAGADVNAPDEWNDTPLHCATIFSHVAVVQALLAAGADVNAANEEGETPLDLATHQNHLPVVAALLASGANRTITNTDDNTAAQVTNSGQIHTIIEPHRAASWLLDRCTIS